MTLKLITKSYPVGYSEMMPEGICGLIEKTSVPVFKFSKPVVKVKRAKPKVVKPPKKKVKVNPILDSAQVKLEVTPIQPPPTKPKPKSKRKKLFGKVGMIPELEINYDNLKLPESIQGLDMSNTVEVSEETLQNISQVTELRTKQLGKLLLSNTAPSILAHAAAVNYVSAVMQDSFDIEFEEDPSISEAIRDITKIEVLEFFTRKLKIPKHRKESIMAAFVDKMTTKTVDRMELALKRESNEQRIKALEAVLVQKSKGADGKTVMRKYGNQVDPGERILERPMITVPERKSKRI